MTMTLPTTETLLLREDGPFLHVTLNRPKARNAMSLTMVKELMAVFTAVADNTAIRAVVLRGAGGHFCAGGDIKDMAGARARLRSEEHTSELQSRPHLVCRLLLEKKKR